MAGDVSQQVTRAGESNGAVDARPEQGVSVAHVFQGLTEMNPRPQSHPFVGAFDLKSRWKVFHPSICGGMPQGSCTEFLKAKVGNEEIMPYCLLSDNVGHWKQHSSLP